MNKQNQILIAILVVQLIIGAAVFWPRAVSQAQSGPLLADFAAANVSSLMIADSDGNSLTLAKNGDGWILPEADDFPADETKITPFLEKLEAVQSNRLVTRTEASHKRLQVADDDFARKLDVTLTDGGSHTLYIGSSAGAGATHVRADSAPEVYLTGELTNWDANTQVSAWIDSLYFTLPQTATVALKLENVNGTVEFVKAGDVWTMKDLAAGETLNTEAVTRLVGAASAVRMARPIGKTEQPEFGMDALQAVVTLQTVNETYTLQIGAKNAEDDSYVLKASDSEYYVSIAAFSGDEFVQKTRIDFLMESTE
jgi:hypothetical protein